MHSPKSISKKITIHVGGTTSYSRAALHLFTTTTTTWSGKSTKQNVYEHLAHIYTLENVESKLNDEIKNSKKNYYNIIGIWRLNGMAEKNLKLLNKYITKLNEKKMNKKMWNHRDYITVDRQILAWVGSL